MRVIRRLAAALILLAVLVAAGLAVARQQFNRYLDAPIAALASPRTIVVEPGSSLTRVVHQLAQEGLLQRPQWLVYGLRLTGQPGLLAGEYELQPGTSPRALLHVMSQGLVKTYQVTLLEGWTVRQALEQLQAQESLVHQLDIGDLANLLPQLAVEGDFTNPEGLFFPDTYHYVRGMSDRDLLQGAYRKMQETLDREWPARAEGLPLSSVYEALVLASIVEKETAVDAERELIAGVFIARLRKGMRLQTDPTVIYAMGDSYRGNIKRRDLAIDSPYNTYRFSGLPPTPIALPSLRSIEATLHPQATDKLYFVARGDGSHHFSATLEEHNSAVREFQIRNRRQNYRSTPAPGPAQSETQGGG